MAPTARNVEPKLAAALTQTQLVYVAGEHYSLVLTMTQRNQEQVTLLTTEMLKVTDCSVCGGQCDPDQHLFSPDSYLPVPGVPEGSPPQFRDALSQLLTQYNIDIPAGDDTEDFVTGASLVDDENAATGTALATLLRACNQRIQAGGVGGGSGSTVSTEQVTDTHQENISTRNTGVSVSDPIIASLIKQQNETNSMMKSLLERFPTTTTRVPVPSSPPLSSRTSRPTVSSGRIGIQTIPNPSNAAFCGMSTTPLLEVQGNIADIDMAKVKRKMTSGEHTSGSLGVLKELRWVHHCISKVACPNPPGYHEMNIAQFFAGMSNLILSELDPSLSGSELENKLRHMSNMAHLAINSPFSSVLNINAQLFRCFEQLQLSWKDWKSLELFTEKTLAQIKMKQNQAEEPPNKKKKVDDNRPENTTKSGTTTILGIDIAWMRGQKVCIKFQLDTCTFKEDHKTAGGNVTLRHVCAGCLKVKDKAEPSHAAKACPNKHLFQK